MLKTGLTLLFFTALVTVSCRRNINSIPQVPVDLVINIQDPIYQSLNGIGGSMEVSGGSRGIIIFRVNAEDFQAYDRHCPYLPDNACGQATVAETNYTALDSCCESQFQLIDGAPISGPATIGLKPYNTSFDGNIIQIWN